MMSTLQLPPSPWQGMRIVTQILMVCAHLNGVMSNSLNVTYHVLRQDDNNCTNNNTMDTKIQLDCREIGMDTTGLVGGWKNLTLITLDEKKIIGIDINEDKVQFRFLQLVHGGDGCNCWKLFMLRIRTTGHYVLVRQIANFDPNMYTCITSTIIPNEHEAINYCGGEVARGFITKVISTNGSLDGCPGDSNNLLSGYNNYDYNHWRGRHRH